LPSARFTPAALTGRDRNPSMAALDDKAEYGDPELKAAMTESQQSRISRIREALRRYHVCEEGLFGEPLTWLAIREEIAEYTGVEIGSTGGYGAERLRQFVNGIRVPGHAYILSFPKMRTA